MECFIGPCPHRDMDRGLSHWIQVL
jgi:hypothetical protein